MSVIVKGMKMPKCCAECPLNHDAECYLYNRLVCEEPYTQRGDWCPLAEIKPHGRLIDADALRENIKESRKRQPKIADDYFIVANWLRSAPTIIEREDET